MYNKIEDIIKAKGYTVTKPQGTSMFPLIHSSDDIFISKAKFPLKIYDIPVYKRENGNYIMHRIVGKDDNGYICCGDNQYVLEYGVKEAQIIGVLTEWYHKDKKHTVNDEAYLRYVQFWCKSLRRRKFILFFCHKYFKIMGAIKQIGYKIFRKKQ